MSLTITTLCENTAGASGVLGEWGLSILLECDGLNILLDTGKGTTLLPNARALGLDLTKLDKIVLSHGHSDHTGGLLSVLGECRNEIEVIAHPQVWQARYARRPGQKTHDYVGIPFQRQALEGMGARFRLAASPVWLSENIVATGEIPLVTDYEKVDDNLMVREGKNWLPDALPDDQALVVKTELGLVVLLGCCHRGIINTLRYARELTGVDEIHAAVGGTHLFRAPAEILERTIEDLKTFGLERLGVSHCTGLTAAARLSQELGDILFFNQAGTRINLIEQDM